MSTQHSIPNFFNLTYQHLVKLRANQGVAKQDVASGNSQSTGCIKKLNRFEIALDFAKQLLVSSF
jgi:hypothetical protein